MFGAEIGSIVIINDDGRDHLDKTCSSRGCKVCGFYMVVEFIVVAGGRRRCVNSSGFTTSSSTGVLVATPFSRRGSLFMLSAVKQEEWVFFVICKFVPATMEVAMTS